MPIYLIIAYVIFITVPLMMALTIVSRRRRVERRIARYEAELDEVA